MRAVKAFTEEKEVERVKAFILTFQREGKS